MDTVLLGTEQVLRRQREGGRDLWCGVEMRMLIGSRSEQHDDRAGKQRLKRDNELGRNQTRQNREGEGVLRSYPGVRGQGDRCYC